MDKEHDYNLDHPTVALDYVPRPMHDFRYVGNIRLLVFLIAGLCAGLPGLIWAARSLHQLRCSGGRVSVFIVSLLFSDALELLLIPFVVIDMFKPEEQRWYFMFTIMFGAVRHYGFCLHQFVALEGIVSLKNPLCSSRLSSPLVSVFLSITLFIFSSTFFFIIPHLILWLLTCILAVTTCILACKASPSLSYTGMNPVLYVTVIAMATLAFLYGPFIVILWMCLLSFSAQCSDSQPWIMSFSIMSMHLIADPLLCVLVCRKIPMANISHRELHTDQGTV